jgi:hypothetical protein
MVFRLLSKNAQEKRVQRIGDCSLDEGKRKYAFAQIITEALVVGVAGCSIPRQVVGIDAHDRRPAGAWPGDIKRPAR